LATNVDITFHGTPGQSYGASLDKDFVPLPPIVCLFLSLDFLLLDVAPFLSLVHVYGTIYLQTLPPHRLCLHLTSG